MTAALSDGPCIALLRNMKPIGDTFRFSVDGIPVAKARPRHVTVKTKRGPKSMSYTPAKTRNWEAYVRYAAFKAMSGKGLMSGPLQVAVLARFPIPASWPKWKRDAAAGGLVGHTTKPDADNVLKAVLDAMNGVVFADDSQVVRKIPEKHYTTSTPGLEVLVQRVAMVGHAASRADLDQLLLELGAA
jgi:Holliday junction resolvase RusA-like endonuclease